MYKKIPDEVFYDKSIPADAKILYGEIQALSTKTGTCWAENKHLAEKFNTSVRSVQRWICSLERAGYILISLNPDMGNRREIAMTNLSRTHDKTVTPPMTNLSRTHDKTVTPIIGINIINNKEEVNSNNEKEITPETFNSKLPEFVEFTGAARADKFDEWGDQIMQDEWFHEQIAMRNPTVSALRSPETRKATVADLLAVFKADKRGLGKTNTDFADFKNNFFSWIRFNCDKYGKASKGNRPVSGITTTGAILDAVQDLVAEDKRRDEYFNNLPD